MNLLRFASMVLLGWCVFGAHAAGICPDIPYGQDQKYRAWFVDAVTGREIANGEILPTLTTVLWHGKAEAYGHCDVYVLDGPSRQCVFGTRQEHVVIKIGRSFYDPTGFLQTFHETFGKDPVTGGTRFWHVLDTTDTTTSTGPRAETIFHEGPYRFMSANVMHPTACNMQPDWLHAPPFTIYGRKPKKHCRSGSEHALFGNPCDALSGVKTQEENDFAVGSFVLRRYYNSDTSSLDMGQGLGWSSALTRRLERGGLKLNIVEAEGHSESFTLTNGVWKGDADTKYTVSSAVDGGYFVRTRNGLFERFDVGGRLLTSTDLHGQVTSYGYDALNKLVRVQAPSGRQLDIAYSGRRMSAISIGSSVVAAYAYGAKGELLSVTHADGTTRSYTYDIRLIDQYLRSALLTGITDESGTLYSSWTYGTDGRVITAEQPGSDVSARERHQFSYSGNEYSGVNTVVDPAGVTWNLTYSSAAGSKVLTRKSRSTDGSSISQAYDGYGNRTQFVHESGVRSCSSYDTVRQLETHRVDGVSSNVTTSCGYLARYSNPLPSGSRRTVTAWHPDWDLQTKVSEPGKITTYVYNGQPDPFNGNAIASCAPATARLPGGKPVAVLCRKVEQASTDANGVLGFSAALRSGGPASANHWTYDTLSLPTTIWQTEGGDGNGVGAVETGRWTLTYNTAGDVTRTTHVASGATSNVTAYDAHGRMLSGTDDSGAAVSLQYSPRGFVTSKTRGSDSISFIQNAIGLTSEVRMPEGQTLRYVYDAKHKLTDVLLNGASITPAMLAALDFPDTPNKALIARLKAAVKRAISALIAPAYAQIAGQLGRQVVPVPGGVMPGQPEFDPRTDMMSVRPISALDRAAVRLVENFARMCECKPDGGYDRPTFTFVTFAHVLFSGHLSQRFSDKSYFASTERVGQVLVDEVMSRGRQAAGTTANRMVIEAELV